MEKVVPLVIDEDEQKLHYGIDVLAKHITPASLAMLGLSVVGCHRRKKIPYARGI
jgi:hypothetical protein